MAKDLSVVSSDIVKALGRFLGAGSLWPIKGFMGIREYCRALSEHLCAANYIKEKVFV